MKNNLILKQFDTDNKPGTLNLQELRTFFGGLVAYIEDDIHINDDAVEFSYLNSGKRTGYQYYDKDNLPEEWETTYIENLSDLKNNNHIISLLNQNSFNLNSNTKWKIEINAREILKYYLFYKFRESRAFQVIKYDEVYNKDINDAIYNYIDWNIINNYKFDNIDMYVLYNDIPKKQSIKKNILLKFEPLFDEDVYKPENKISNFNIVQLDEYRFDKVIINYFQTKPSNKYKFDYYFNIKFIKI